MRAAGCAPFRGLDAAEIRSAAVSTVVAFSPFMAVDGVWYRAKQGPCEDLSAFGNRVLEGQG